MINDLEHRLRQELQGALVPHDARRADEMTTIAVQAAQLGLRRPWAAPAVAAAAVIAGGGIAAATTSGGNQHATPPAGGVSTPTWAHPTCVTLKVVDLNPGGATTTVTVPAIATQREAERESAIERAAAHGSAGMQQVQSCAEVSVRPIPLITGRS